MLAAGGEDLVAAGPARRTALAAALAAAATLLTPFGAEVWTYVAELATNPVIRSVVSEWQPPGLSPPGVVLYASVALAAIALWRHPRAVPWPVVGAMAVFAVLAASSERAIAWWGLLLPVALARLPWAARSSATDPRARANWVLIGAVAAIPLLALSRWLPSAGDVPPPNLLSFAPREVTTELRSILMPGEPFRNPQAWGSWFELALPDHRIFVDSRFELMPVASVEANRRIAGARPGWEDDLDRLPVRVLVVDREREATLVQAVAASSVWRRVYEDDDGMIFVRDDREPVSFAPGCPPG
jgi:hypothetical protein